MTERVQRHVLEGIAAEAVERPLWDRLGQLSFPVLVMRGDRKGTILNDETGARWLAALPDGEVVTIHGAGHDLWGPDPAVYRDAIVTFLARLDAS